MKKILIIAPYFPPSAMPPSQRVRLLVRHLQDLGWVPVILTVDHYYREEVADPWMIELAGNKFTKVEVKCLDQRKTRKFGIGDLGIRLLPFLFFSLIKLCRREKPDILLYPVPTWYIITIAPVVKWLTGVPYAIDFIDPWVRRANRKNLKARASQWVAKIFERFAVKSSTAIFAVSQGILNDLIERYPSIIKKKLVAVPYGVELADYQTFKPIAESDRNNSKVMIRYIGALSDSMLRVARVLIQAIGNVAKSEPLQIEFIGTSYAGTGLVKPRLRNMLDELGVADVISERPERITYQKALELTRSAGILLLIGDMTPYYAASKLMGLIASQQPFFALLHEQSFPAKFLQQFNYPYMVTYSSEDGSLPEQKLDEATTTLKKLIRSIDSYQPIPPDEPAFLEHTALGMTKKFTDTLQNI